MLGEEYLLTIEVIANRYAILSLATVQVKKVMFYFHSVHLHPISVCSTEVSVYCAICFEPCPHKIELHDQLTEIDCDSA